MVYTLVSGKKYFQSKVFNKMGRYAYANSYCILVYNVLISIVCPHNFMYAHVCDNIHLAKSSKFLKIQYYCHLFNMVFMNIIRNAQYLHSLQLIFLIIIILASFCIRCIAISLYYQHN